MGHLGTPEEPDEDSSGRSLDWTTPQAASTADKSPRHTTTPAIKPPTLSIQDLKVPTPASVYTEEIKGRRELKEEKKTASGLNEQKNCRGGGGQIDTCGV